jgi:hypothetical protein
MSERASSKSRKRRDRRPSAPPPGDGLPEADQHDADGLRAYLTYTSPPALADTSSTYMEVYALVRAVLDRVPACHAHTAIDAAQDAAEDSYRRRPSGGGQNR